MHISISWMLYGRVPTKAFTHKQLGIGIFLCLLPIFHKLSYEAFVDFYGLRGKSC